MYTLPTAGQTHIAGSLSTLAVCWRVTRRDGMLILGTEHDQDISITTGDLSGTYLTTAGITGSDTRSTSDMSADNTEVQGAIKSGDLSLIDLSAADIEAGLLDDAAVTLFMVNWEAPDEWQRILRTGNIGAITRTSEGQYRTELRGLAQRLAQKIVRTYGAMCDAELGDTRCKFAIETLAKTGTVTAVTSNRRFTVSWGGPAPSAGDFDGGKLTWSAGANDNFEMEIKQDAVGAVVGDVMLFLPMPNDVQIGDTFTARPGCDKSAAMCRGRFNNLVNFRGHGAWVPGAGEMMVFGGQTTQRKPRADSYWDWPRTDPDAPP